ncbi:MAG TPA: tellurite resistance TerB family protein [Polyangiaceae bacterium]|nr:tellurite resistance TerB family protein [Polyangiaceae bacterium]
MAGGGRGYLEGDTIWWRLGIKDRLGELVGACYCVAASDGHVADAEIAVIAEQIVAFAEREVGLGEVEGLLTAARDEVRSTGIEGYVAGLGRRLDEEARSQLLSAAAATMLADGEVSVDERRVYFQIARALGMPEPEAEFLIDTVEASRRELQRRNSSPGPLGG